MAKVSLWKRVGGWLRRSQATLHDPRAMDMDGLLIESETLERPETPPDMPDSTPLVSRGRKDQIMAMEEGFNRLVIVLESINANVLRQGEANLSVRGAVDKLPALVDEFIGALHGQREHFACLAEEARRQSLQGERLNELLKNLPEVSAGQLEHLEGIWREAQDTTRSSHTMMETLERLDDKSRDMAHQGKAQADFMRDMSEAFRQSQVRMEVLLKRQMRWFRVLSFIVIVILLIGAAIALFAWWSTCQTGAVP